jgi:hypothetical protein
MVKLKFFIVIRELFSKMQAQRIFSNPATFALLLILQIMRSQLKFLVYHDGRLYFLKISRFCLNTTIDIIHQFPNLQGLSNEAQEEILLCLKASFQQLSFMIEGQLVFVDWEDVVFEGELGRRRTLKILLPNGQEAFAKYTGNRGDLFIFEVIGTNEIVEIPLANILDHTQPPSEVLQKYKVDLAAKKAAAEKAARAAEEAARAAEKAARAAEKAARAAEKAARAAEEAQQQSEAYKARMRKQGEIVSFPQIQRNYPLFTSEFMLILFFLCKRFGIEISFGYRFNLVVRRLTCFVCRSESQPDQSRFPFPELPKEDKEAFEAFAEKYMTQFVGRVIRSRTIRFQLFIAPIESRIPEYLHRFFEYHCHLTKKYSPTQADVDTFLRQGDEYFSRLAEEMATRSESPLTLSDEYWTNWREFGVLTMLTKSRYPMCEVIFPMVPTPIPFPCDLF